MSSKTAFLLTSSNKAVSAVRCFKKVFSIKNSEDKNRDQHHIFWSVVAVGRDSKNIRNNFAEIYGPNIPTAIILGLS